MDAENHQNGADGFYDVNPVEGHSTQSIKENDMSENSTTKNFFENPNSGSPAAASGWSAAGGALVGSLLGENGVLGGGNKNQSVTPDQLGTAINGLRSSMNTDSLEAHLDRIGDKIGSTTADSTVALGLGIAGVKDAITAGNSQNALSLCSLGNSIAQGFAQTNFNIQAQGAASRELALQQALDTERARATELRIALSEHKNQAGHATTQVLLNQVIAGNA